MEDRNKRVLFIDNFDSFTYNLVDDFCKRKCDAKVYRADTPLADLKQVADEYKPDLLLIVPALISKKGLGYSYKPGLLSVVISWQL